MPGTGRWGGGLCPPHLPSYGTWHPTWPCPCTGGRRAATWAWLTSRLANEGPCAGMARTPPQPARDHPGASVVGRGGTGTRCGGLCTAPSANPPPCPGRAKTHPIFWVGMPKISGYGVLGAAAVPPPSVLGPRGSLDAGAPPKRGGVPGYEAAGCGGIYFSAMGPAWRPGPFREVEEGEVSWRHGRVGTSITRVSPPIPQHRPQLGLGSPSGMFPG